MLHVICATMILGALLAETTVIRQWTERHAVVQQVAAARVAQTDSQVRN
jgi:hypothetical protein